MYPHYPHIEAQLICDSIGPDGARLCTYLLKYPRYIHAELMTHRVFSRNAQSSRAIPFKKRLAQVFWNPVTPIRFGGNKAGMQAKEGEIHWFKRTIAAITWKIACKLACGCAWILNLLGLHKQWVNRLIEPFDTITVVVSSTYWKNFFHLRVDSAAMPEIYELARRMKDLYDMRKPMQMPIGEWHLPFIVVEDLEQYTLEELKIISVARCARTSYLNFQGKRDLADDKRLFTKLIMSDKVHASPFEHVARCSPGEYSGNFYGWHQYRKDIPNEALEETFGGNHGDS